ncbi:MAG: hypothetical protein H6718_06550 [Polyangiaceae bacterium]|nr:hypothetical protein [Myxococcales bacterium]MCB9585039.1 hypothetical protein [Polyangiaceae bacterium]MCB9610070.1 hypothetical protein [Polyangiaceae bacterium]
MLHYLTLLTQALTEGDLLDALGEATPEAKEAMTTLAEKWMAQGEARGEAKGRVEGERRALERLLRRKFGDAALDDSVLSRLAAADEAQLEHWTDRVLDARQLEDVFS